MPLCLCHYVPVMSLWAIMLCCSHWWHKTLIYGDSCVFVTLPLCRLYVTSMHQALHKLVGIPETNSKHKIMQVCKQIYARLHSQQKVNTHSVNTLSKQSWPIATGGTTSPHCWSLLIQLHIKQNKTNYFISELTVTSQIITVLSFDPVASFVPSWENLRNQTCNRSDREHCQGV